MSLTMKQIADMAGVSRGTVDRALNGRLGVSEKTRNKVLKIANEMQYSPNMLGAALSKKQRRFSIGVIISQDPFFAQIREGMEYARKHYSEYGIDVVFVGNSSKTPETEYAFMQELIAQKVDGLILAPASDDRIRQQINELAAQNMPVITFSSDIPDSSRLCFVGQDAYRSGQAAGNLIGKLMHGGGKLLMVTSSLPLSGLVNRAKGCLEKLAEAYPGIEIMEPYEYKDDGYREFVRFLSEHRDIRGLLANADYDNGVANAVRQLGLANSLYFVTFDTRPETVRALQEGLVDFTITQDPYRQGYLPIQLMAERLLFGKKPEKEYYFTPIGIQLPETLDEALPQTM